MSLGPPWVLFTDNGKPIAILPAGRPGEVANVEGLTMGEAHEIVRIANKIHHRLTMEKLNELQKRIESDVDKFILETASGKCEPCIVLQTPWNDDSSTPRSRCLAPLPVLGTQVTTLDEALDAAFTHTYNCENTVNCTCCQHQIDRLTAENERMRKALRTVGSICMRGGDTGPRLLECFEAERSVADLTTIPADEP